MTSLSRKPWSDEARTRHSKAMAAMAAEPGIGCVNCRQILRPSGFSRHLNKCLTFVCPVVVYGTQCPRGIRHGGRGYCSIHYSVYKKLKQYDLEVNEYYKMCQARAERCDICNKKCAPMGWARVVKEERGWTNIPYFSILCVDHDHSTNQVRGLLCHSCNVAIGHMKDNAEILRLAASYLENHAQ